MVKLDFAKAKLAVQTLLNRKTFIPQKLRGLLLGITFTTTLAEVCVYKLIKQNIRSGETPPYMTDLLIIMLSLFEGLIAPFVSWWGFRRRRTLLIAYSASIAIFVTSWFFLPSVKETTASDLCNITGENTKFDGMTTNAVIRLVILVLCCICFIVARVGCWSHGVAYSDEYAPSSTSLHYGILLLPRVIGLVLGDRVLTGILDTNLKLQISLIFILQALNVIQLFVIVPKVTPEVDGEQKTALPHEDRGFLLSIGRVLCNPVAMTQLFAIGLIATALWGYGYNEIDIIRVKFNIVHEKVLVMKIAELILYTFLVICVVHAGWKSSAPVMVEYCNLKAIKQVLIMSVLSLIVYLVLTFAPKCNTGEIGPIGSHNENFNECNLKCNCDQIWLSYQPVCLVEDMVTYESPCHAGCNTSETINDIVVYSNCACGSGRVTVGACSDPTCKPQLYFHAALFFLLVALTLLAFQAQGVLLLRVVDKRDKSVVMGLAWSAVAIISFVCGQLLFLGIRGSICDSNVVGNCIVRNQMFPLLLGATCAFLMLLSILVSIGSWIYLRVNRVKINEMS